MCSRHWNSSVNVHIHGTSFCSVCFQPASNTEWNAFNSPLIPFSHQGSWLAKVPPSNHSQQGLIVPHSLNAVDLLDRIHLLACLSGVLFYICSFQGIHLLTRGKKKWRGKKHNLHILMLVHWFIMSFLKEGQYYDSWARRKKMEHFISLLVQQVYIW